MPPETPPTHVEMQASNKSSSGPVVGIIIIVLLMLVGALYVWNQGLSQRKTQDQLPIILPGGSTSTVATTTISSSTAQ